MKFASGVYTPNKETSALSREIWTHQHLNFSLSHPVWHPPVGMITDQQGCTNILCVVYNLFYLFIYWCWHVLKLHLKTMKNKNNISIITHIHTDNTSLNHFCHCDDLVRYFFSVNSAISSSSFHLLNFVLTDPYSRYSVCASAQYHLTVFRWACN